MKKQQRKRSANAGMAVLVVGLAALVGFFGWALWKGSKPSQAAQDPNKMNKQNQATCTHGTGKADIPGLETVLCKSANHVNEGQTVNYDTDPPLSGNHWPSWINPGFYQADQPKEKLVHSLEHGYIVIYYNQTKLAPGDLDYIKGLTAKYQGQWDGVVAVPRADAQSPLILTAWEHALRMPAFDQSKVDAFVDAFRGRGPENPVRK